MLMDPPVAAALIAAVASLGVAIWTAVYSRRNTADLERLKRALALEDEELRTVTQFLRNAATEIQAFRDAVQMVLRAPAGTMSTEAAILTLRAGWDRYSATYRDYVGAVPLDISGLTHDVKQQMFACVRDVERGLTEETRRRLEDRHVDLRLIEAKLVGIRLELLRGYTKSGQP